MAINFKKAFNSQVKIANKLNQGLNKVIGKEIFGEVHELEETREFAPYESFPKYSEPEPAEWPQIEGEQREFTLNGNLISFPKELDTCLRYREYFKRAAEFYAAKFEFKYNCCVEDFDTLVYYFPQIYGEGLGSMCKRAYSLLLPAGVFSVSVESFIQKHASTYHAAIDSYETMAGIEMNKNAAAESLGNQVGNAVQMQGGGFGIKGAMKGVAQAEAFNFGMNIVGKFFAQQSKMTKAEKERVYSLFKQNIFFQEVLRDYQNTFYTVIQILSENGILGNITTVVSSEMKTTLTNLQNPMFPKDKLAPVLAHLISINPFNKETLNVLKDRFGSSEEAKKICEYFAEPQI